MFQVYLVVFVVAISWWSSWWRPRGALGTVTKGLIVLKFDVWKFQVQLARLFQILMATYPRFECSSLSIKLPFAPRVICGHEASGSSDWRGCSWPRFDVGVTRPIWRLLSDSVFVLVGKSTDNIIAMPLTALSLALQASHDGEGPGALCQSDQEHPEQAPADANEVVLVPSLAFKIWFQVTFDLFWFMSHCQLCPLLLYALFCLIVSGGCFACN